MASVPFSFPDKSPTASTILQAVDASLLDIPNLSPVLRSKMRQYVRNIAAKDAVDPSSMIPPSQTARYDALETSVKQILQANGESADHVLRFKRPTGPITARAGNLLFYPPSSSPKTARDTLVMGPDTTERMLAAGLSDAGLFTMDLYPFSTRIPKNAATLRTFKFDTTLRNTKTAKDLWQLLTSDAAEVYRERAILPGLEVIWGKPVKSAYTTATETTHLPSSWAWIQSTATIDIPGIENEHGSFPADSLVFEFQICYRYFLGKWDFGKLVIRHPHPCYSGVIKRKGLRMTADMWRQALLTDALVQLLFLVSCGENAPPCDPASTFASVAQPSATDGTQCLPGYMRLALRRREEISKGVKFSRAEIDAKDSDLMGYIEKNFEIDENKEASILAQATSGSAKRSRATVKAKKDDAYYAAYGKVQRVTRSADKPVRHAALMDEDTSAMENWNEHFRTYRLQKSKPGIKPAPIKQKIITELRDALLLTRGLPNSPQSFANWPDGLPYASRAMNADELDYVGAWLLAGKFKLNDTVRPEPLRHADLMDGDTVAMDKWHKHVEACRQKKKREGAPKLKSELHTFHLKQRLAGELRTALLLTRKLPSSPTSFVNWPASLPFAESKWNTAESDHIGVVGSWLLAGKFKLVGDDDDSGGAMNLEKDDVDSTSRND